MKIRRRKYLINKPLQFIYSGIIIYLLLIGIIIAGVGTYYLTFNTILNELDAQGGMANAYELVKSINFLILSRVGLMLVVILLFAFVFGIFYLHRIAGPIFRIERTIREIAEGKKVEPIRLRKKDFFKSLADALNKLIEKQNIN
ncbi:MAG: methyl-accepting chemotaxis protein [bacterium]|nr:methyl-accepting chemotaxis protein [bacterium]